MIDVIINDSGVMTIAHDMKSLDDFTEMRVSVDDGAITLVSGSNVMAIGHLRRKMLELVVPGMKGRLVRTTGWSIAKISPINVVLIN